MGKNWKKWMMYSNSAFYLLGKSGALGEDGKEAADEYESEIGGVIAIVLFIFFLIGIGYLVVSFVPAG